MRFLGGKAEDEFVDYQDLDWTLEDFIGGCPVGVLPPGNMPALQVIRDPVFNNSLVF